PTAGERREPTSVPGFQGARALHAPVEPGLPVLVPSTKTPVGMDVATVPILPPDGFAPEGVPDCGAAQVPTTSSSLILSPPSRRARSWRGRVGGGVALGLARPWILRPPLGLAERAAVHQAGPAVRSVEFARVASRSDETFPTVEAAVAAAVDGDTVTLHGNGPF